MAKAETPIDRTKVRRAAQRFFDDLSPSQRGELADALVLGTLDWSEWLSEPAPRGFWSAVGAICVREQC
jgi:hypothetical protein